MKKLITYSILCAFIGITISSCKSGLSITKRHYTKGYHIARNHKAKATSPQTKLNDEKYARVEKINKTEKLLVLNEENVLKLSSKTNSIAVESTIIASATKKQTKISEKNVPAFFRIPGLSLDEHKIKLNNTSVDSKIGSAEHTHDGLSLFWLVILVIVILWALGVLAGGFGLGGLIHLLLVIALILLILWLLRVI